MKFASTNQKHYPDLRSDASSVWNFCACFSDVVSQENHWCHHKICLFSQSTPKGVMSQGCYFFRSILYWSHYLVPFPHTKCSCRVMEKISKKFLQGVLTDFNLCLSFPSIATDNRKQYQCLSVVLALVVQMLDSTIDRNDHYPVDKY